MKLDIPFVKQTNPLNCGIAALKMVLDSLDNEEDFESLEKLAGIKEGKGIFTVQLAIAAAKKDYDVKLYSIEEGFNENHFDKEFYKRFADEEFMRNYEGFFNLAKSLNVQLNKKSLKMESLLSFLDSGVAPIILIDWNVVEGNSGKGYQGHFVVLIGYEGDFVYIHNPSIDEGKFMKVPLKTFDEARKSDGTDEDVLIIQKK